MKFHTGFRGLLGFILICCGLALGLFVLMGVAHCQTILMPPPKVQFFNGAVPVAGGCVGTFQSGTLTPLASFTDNTGLTQNTNPVTLDANGMAPIWLSSSATYRIVVSAAPSFPFTCATGPGPQLYVTDGIVGVGGGGGGGTVSLAGNNAWTGSNSWSGTSTFNGPLVAPKLGPSTGQQHVIPAVASDTFALLNATQTLANKTITNPTVTTGTFSSPTLSSPTITSPTINSVTFSNSPSTYFVVNNDGSTGTATNTLTSLTGSAQLIKTSAGATGGVLGICISGCAIGGSGTVQMNGLTLCQFDGSATNNDYVQISTSTAGNCHDTGSTSYPGSGGQVIGKTFSGGVGAGLYSIFLSSPDIQPPGAIVAKADTGNLTANVGNTTLITPSANGLYIFWCYLVITQAATTSSTLPSCQFGYNDGDTNVAKTGLVTNTNITNAVGATGPSGAGTSQAAGEQPFFARAGVAIQYFTQSYASSGATTMIYALHVRLMGPF